MDKKLRQLEEEQKRLMEEIEKNNKRIYSNQKSQGTSDVLNFLIGIVLLGAGLFWVFQSVKVTTGWGSFYRLGNMAIPNGVVIIPLLIGVAMLFVMKRKIFGWIVTAIGVVTILLTIISSVSFYFVSQSLLSYIFMFGFIVVGVALLLKSIFMKH